ncbi:hypothetical protein [Novosphingobium sp.]|uniref:hypothetical protein n=1 Tax=Novosphingobium sp. TaxID=1874826 RepID=UPI0038B8E2B1
MQQHTAAADAALPSPPSAATALALTLGIVVLIGGFLAVGSALKLEPLYAAFLLLWFWTSVDGTRFNALPATVIGAFGGLANSYLLQSGTHGGNGALAVLALLLMVFALFMLIAQRLPILFNPSYMLFLTVLNAPLIQQGESFAKVMAATAFGIVWFGASAWLAQQVIARRQGSALTPAA